MPKFYNTDGSLTVYSFACGYIKTHKTDQPGGLVSLYKDGCWHVQARDDNRSRYVWETFETLTEARKFFNKKCNFN